MATTKANNNGVNNLYAAVAKYANEVFNNMIRPNDTVVRMTASEVNKAIAKANLLWKEGADTNQAHTIETEGMSLTTSPVQVFAQLASLESMLKIKKADRMMFAHQHELLKAEQVKASCMIPADVTMLCKYAADNELRSVMNGVCFDFEKSTLVASDGHVLVVVPMQACAGEGRWIVPTKFLEAHAGGIIQFTTIDGVQYAYVCGERTRLIEGRYPYWQTVIPACDTTPIHIGSAWKEVIEKCSMLAKVHSRTHMVIMEGKQGEHTLTITGRDVDFGVEQKEAVCIDGEIPYDFSIGMNGSFLKNYPPFTDMYLHDATRAALFTDGVCVMLQMPMLIGEDDCVTWTAPTTKNVLVPEVLQDKTKTDAEPTPVSEPKPVCEEPEEEPGTEKVVINGVVVAEVSHHDITDEPEPAPVSEPESVCEQPEKLDHAEALINGEWERVEVLATTGQRLMVRRENKQRAIVKMSEVRGPIVNNTADAPSATPVPVKEEVKPEPVCETPVKPETVKPETTETDDRVYIAKYSEKSFLVWGNTKMYRKELKKYGAWIGKYEGWCLSNKRREFVEKLIGNNLQAATELPAAKETASKPAQASEPEPAPVKENAMMK